MTDHLSAATDWLDQELAFIDTDDEHHSQGLRMFVNDVLRSVDFDDVESVSRAARRISEARSAELAEALAGEEVPS